MDTTTQEILRSGQVPTAPLLPHVKRAIASQNFSPQDNIHRLVIKMEKETDRIGFDTADRLFCKLGIAMVWRTHLEEIYEGVVFDGIRKYVNNRRCARRGCSNEFRAEPRGGDRRLYCSDACKHASWKLRAGKTKGTPRGPGRKLEKLRCAKGHDRTPENTKIDDRGVAHCMDCRAIAQKRYRARKKQRLADAS